MAFQGYALSRLQIPSGGVLGVNLRWQALGTPSRDYRYDVWLRDENGFI